MPGKGNRDGEGGTITMKVALETNQLIALAMKQIEPHVVAAYPITPSTEVVQEFSQYVANGDVKTEFVPVESEHSAMSACLAVLSFRCSCHDGNGFSGFGFHVGDASHCCSFQGAHCYHSG